MLPTSPPAAGRLASIDMVKGWAILGHGRSDIVAAGALVIGCLARRFPSRGLMCSTQGLRYGLARLALTDGHPLA